MDWQWNLVKTCRAVDAARRIKVAFFAVNNVFFSPDMVHGTEKNEKARSHVDGQGITWLRAAGIEVVLVTSQLSDTPTHQMVERWNNIPSCKTGALSQISLLEGCRGSEKVLAAEGFLCSKGLTFADCSHMGADVVDLPLLSKVALPVAPRNAERVVLDTVLLRTGRESAKGAVRDFVDLVLAAREIDPTNLPTS